MLGNLKSDKLEDIKSVLETLTVTVESINKSLSGELGGKESPQSTGNVSQWLRYIGGSLNKINSSQTEIRTLLIEFNNQMNETFKNSIDSVMQGLSRSSGFQGGPAAPQIIQENFAPKIILDIKQKLMEIDDERSKEMDLLTKQNEALRAKLTSIESQITQLKDSLNKALSKY